jgi:hypothetical protein
MSLSGDCAGHIIILCAAITYPNHFSSSSTKDIHHAKKAHTKYVHEHTCLKRPSKHRALTLGFGAAVSDVE